MCVRLENMVVIQSETFCLMLLFVKQFVLHNQKKPTRWKDLTPMLDLMGQLRQTCTDGLKSNVLMSQVFTHNVRRGWRRSFILPRSQLYHPVGGCLMMDECIVNSMFCQSCVKTLHVYATIPPGSCGRLIYSVRGRGGVWLVVFCSWMQKS